MVEIILLSIIILLQLFTVLMCWAIGSKIAEVLQDK